MTTTPARPTPAEPAAWATAVLTGGDPVLQPALDAVAAHPLPALGVLAGSAAALRAAFPLRDASPGAPPHVQPTGG